MPSDLGTLTRVGNLGQALPIGGFGGDGGQGPGDGADSETLPAEDAAFTLGTGSLSLAVVAALSAVTALAAMVRRRLVRRQLRAALVNRLAGLRRAEATTGS